MFKKKRRAGNVVSIDSLDGYILFRLSGKQTEETFQKAAFKLGDLVTSLHEKSKAVYVLIDASDLRENDMDSETRSELRALANHDVDGVAIVAKGQILSSLMSSTKIATPAFPVQFFNHRRAAETWLRENLDERWTYPLSSLVAAILITLIGVLGLIGWATDNLILKSFLPNERPINPMAAVGLLNMGLIFFAYYRGWFRVHRIAGALSIMLGLAALSSLPVDTLLFAHKLALAGAHTQIADTAAVSFICVGVCAFVSTTRRWPVRIIGHLAVLIIIGLAGFNIYGQLYAHDFIYSISGSFVMALNLALAFLIAAIVGVLLVFLRHQVNLISKVSPLGWLVIVAIALLQLGGFIYWQQLRERDNMEATQAFMVQESRLNDTIKTRITAYTDALRGFQGLFASSDNVSQSDFATYFGSLNLNANYPGLRSMTFIGAAKTADIPALVKKYRADTSLFPGGNPTFTPTKVSSAPIHLFPLYFSTYTSLSKLYSGTDLTTIPGREEIYTGALQSNTPRASGTITFLQAPNTPAETGFFIVVPVHTSISQEPIGVVNANFQYNKFFPQLIGDDLEDNDLSAQILDGSTPIYQSSTFDSDAGSPYASVATIPIANREWTMNVRAGKDFGVTADKQRTQYDFIASLVLLTALLFLMLVIQGRTRRRAVALANEMTADLQHERRRTMEANQKDEAIITSIGDGVIVFDTEGIVERSNRIAERLFGVEEGGLTGKNLTAITPAYDLDGKKIPTEKRPFEKAMKSRKTQAEKVYYERTNGTRFPVELNVSPIILNGKTAGAIEVFHDITADLQLDRAKSEFVSLASHQLRTPLSAINWYSEMLLNGDSGKLNEEQAMYVKEIFEGNTRMIELVNALLDVSRLEVGRMTFTPEKLNLADIIQGQENDMRVTVELKKMKFTKHVDPSVTEVVNDRKMVGMVVQNLLSNALKYTDAGGHITVTLRPATKAEVEHIHLPVSQSYVLFSVQDNGLGIPSNQQKRIFEKMYRAENVQVTDVEGTGLGLYIVKEVVTQMGGWIGFESIEKKGSTFTVIVPVVAKEKSVEKPLKQDEA